MFKYRSQLIVIIFFSLFAHASVATKEFDKQKPNDVSDAQWNTLRTAVQESILLPNTSLAESDNYFGLNVAIYGTTALIGAPGSTIGSPGEFFGTDGNKTGAVYVLDFVDDKWVNSTLLKADDGAAGDRFGSAVSLYQDWAVIGASGKDHNDSFQDKGAVYIFKRSIVNAQTVWAQYDQLSQSHLEAGEDFGNSVSIHDSILNGAETIVVGAHKADDNGSNSGAIYIYELDGSDWTQVNKFIAPDGAASDDFGFSVSINNNTIAVGSPADDDNGSSSGSVYIYRKTSIHNPWFYSAKITADDADAADNFGSAVSVGTDNRVLIGARVADSADDSKQNVGSAYIFEFESSVWTQKAKLEAADQSINDYFGTSVSLNGDRALIGAYGNDDGGLNSGSAYVFDYDGSSWTQTQKLIASDDFAGDEFGAAVGLDGDHLIIGSPKDDDDFSKSGSSYGFNYNGSIWNETTKNQAAFNSYKLNFSYDVSLDNDRALIGTNKSSDVNRPAVAYIFDYINGDWELTTTLTSDYGEIGDSFGRSVSLLGDRAIVGAPYNDVGFGDNVGSVYVFDLQQGTWVQTAMLTPSQISDNTLFGDTVELGDDRLVVSTSKEYVSVFDYDGSTWNESIINHNQGSSSIYFGRSMSLYQDRLLIGAWRLDQGIGLESGAAFIFDYDNNEWTQTAILTAIDGNAGDRFGFDVSLSEDLALISATQNDDVANNSGSVYVFEYFDSSWSQSAKLVASNASEFDEFGKNVVLDGARALISGGDYVYVFDIGIQQWSETEIISNPDFSAGRSLDFHNNKALIGSFFGQDHYLNGQAYIYQIDRVYAVGGTISGLVNTIELQNNSNETIVIDDNGVFEFPPTEDGSFYDIEILNQPNNPNQQCQINNASGQINGADVSNVNIICVNTQHLLSVNVTGLDDNSSVQFSNGNDQLNVTSNGFSHFGYYDINSMYEVITTIQPTMPNQVCTVTNGSGQITNNDILVEVECVTTQYLVGVSVANLADNSTIIVSNNGEELIVNSGSTSYFATAIDDFSSYAVTIDSQPTMPNQICSVANGSGDVNGMNVVISINCEYQQYRIRVSAQGLLGTVVVESSGEMLTITDDSFYFFNTTYDDGSNYDVTIVSQPQQANQVCTVLQGSGQFTGVDANVTLDCDYEQFTLSVNVTGLSENGGFVLIDTQTQYQLVVSNNGHFTFNATFDSNSSYILEFLNDPSEDQTCIISPDTGTFNASNQAVDINCVTNTYFVGGTITGLLENNFIELKLNTSIESFIIISFTENTSTFVFPEPIVNNTNYFIDITSQPINPIQDCFVSNRSGTINYQDVIDVDVSCSPSDELIFKNDFD